MNNNVKFSQKEAKDLFNQYGFQLIDEYVNNRTPCLCEDNKGYRYYIRLDNLQYNYKPILWGKSNIGNLEHNLKLFLSNSKILYHSYKYVHSKGDSRILVTLICTCGDTFIVPLTKLVNHAYKNLLCNKCKKKYYPNGMKRTKEELIREFEQMGYIVEYISDGANYKTKVQLQDNFGFRGISTLNSCKQNKHFATFDITNNRDNFVYNANLLLQSNNYNTKCLGFIDKTHLQFLCGCGTKFILTQSQFRNGKYRCDVCTKKYSSLELMVKSYLEENHVNFITQYKYKDCIDILPLPFDFYLTDYNVLLEIDGKQHFEPAMGGEKGFEIRQKHDTIKNQYCLDNHIELIRIPYTAFNKSENWKTYLLQFIKV